MECAQVSYSRHALERMFARAIRLEQVRSVLLDGVTVEVYPDDKPYPSSLLVGRIGETWLHVVAAYDREARHCIVVTAYVPDPRTWDETFRRRRQL
jgi:hypothetical protein